MISGGITFLLLLSGAAAPAATAGVPTAQARIEAAARYMDALEYQRAADELDLVLLDEGLSPAQRLEASLAAGIAKRVLGNDAEARLHFLYVLRSDPTVRLPADTPPKILSFYELVRQEVEMGRMPPGASSAAAAPAAAEAGTSPLLLAGAVVGLSGVVVATGSLLGALAFDSALGDPQSSGEAKATQYQAGTALLVIAALGAVGGVAGGGMALVGSFE